MSQRPIPGFIQKCPFPQCISHSTDPSVDPNLRRYRRFGSYYRSSDSSSVPRYLCLSCHRTFSSARFFPTFRQKKRQLNSKVTELLCSAVSQRRTALLLGINYKTVVRKFLFGAEQARVAQAQLRKMLEEAALTKTSRLELLQFDEMESFEHSKCKPVSIPLIVDAKSRMILAIDACSMPAKGLLASIAKKKYGYRPDHREKHARELLKSLGLCVDLEETELRSDRNPKYPNWVQSELPGILHTTIKGKRGCIVGQGELKKTGFDPLFALNHTAAMIRANVNRLARKTWCTTKRLDRLVAHLTLYAHFHNTVLVAA